MPGAVDDEPARALRDRAREQDDRGHRLARARHAVDQQQVVGVRRVERVQALQRPPGQRVAERDARPGCRSRCRPAGSCRRRCGSTYLRRRRATSRPERQRRAPQSLLREQAVLDARVACHRHLARDAAGELCEPLRVAVGRRAARGRSRAGRCRPRRSCVELVGQLGGLLLGSPRVGVQRAPALLDAAVDAEQPLVAALLRHPLAVALGRLDVHAERERQRRLREVKQPPEPRLLGRQRDVQDLLDASRRPACARARRATIGALQIACAERAARAAASPAARRRSGSRPRPGAGSSRACPPRSLPGSKRACSRSSTSAPVERCALRGPSLRGRRARPRRGAASRARLARELRADPLGRACAARGGRCAPAARSRPRGGAAPAARLLARSRGSTAPARRRAGGSPSRARCSPSSCAAPAACSQRCASSASSSSSSSGVAWT